MSTETSVGFLAEFYKADHPRIFRTTVYTRMSLKSQLWTFQGPVYYLPSLGAGLCGHCTALAILGEFEADVIHVPDHIVKYNNDVDT